jgi:phage I-like protein
MTLTHHICAAPVAELSALAEGEEHWVQLLPAAGEPFRAIDGRGPWRYDDAAELIARSFSGVSRIFIDINHATTRSAPKGGEAPAVGWIEEMQARPDGIWGRVTWNRRGAELMADRAYHGISPVILFDAADRSRVVRIHHASLTNTPALGGAIASLSEETDMNMPNVAKALGLAEDAGEDAILDAIAKLKDGGPKPAELTALAAALGAEDGATIAELTVTARTLGARAGEADRVAELSGQIAEMQGEAWIKDKIAEGWGIDAEMRAELIAVWQDNPGRAEKLVARMPKLSPTHTGSKAPATGGAIELTAEHKAVARMMGLTDDQMLDGLKADRAAMGEL